MDRFSKLFSRAVGFAQKDIWRIRLTELSPGKSFLINLMRVLILSIRGFDEDKCQLRASALTFYSLISIVPVAAMAFGIAKGFDRKQDRLVYDRSDKELHRAAARGKDILQRARDEAHRFAVSYHRTLRSRRSLRGTS